MPFRHVKAHQRSASTARQGFQDMGGKRTKQDSRFDNDARPGRPTVTYNVSQSNSEDVSLE